MRDMGAIQLWGGIECTINRVGDRFVDQLERCGHYTRDGDLEAIAALGIKALRFPVLWERVAPDGIARADWRGADCALGRLRDLGVEPIVGLVHHGSGPSGTHLLDPRFPQRLAEYAGAFAERYPWVRRYTPINEPLTTARFAGLYGHWYPHGRDDRTVVTVPEPQFDSQEKKRLNNLEVEGIVAGVVSEYLAKHLEEHPKEAKVI